MAETPKTNDPNYRMGIAAPEEPTMRQSAQQAIANFLLGTGLISDNYRAQRTGEAIVGTTREDAPAMGIGLTDFTPGGLAFIPEDVKEQVDQGNYVTAGVVGGLSALEAYPLTKALVKPTKNFLMNLASKATPQTAAFDQTRRDLMQGSLAAGALSTLPVVQQVAKAVDDAPSFKFHEGRHAGNVVDSLDGLNYFEAIDDNFIYRMINDNEALKLDNKLFDYLPESGDDVQYILNRNPSFAGDVISALKGSDNGKNLDDYFEGKIDLEDLPQEDREIITSIQDDLIDQEVEVLSREAVRQARQEYIDLVDNSVNDKSLTKYFDSVDENVRD